MKRRLREIAMPCPKCGGDVVCKDSRPGPNNSIRRRRHCQDRDCQHRFTTYELRIAETPLTPEGMRFLINRVIDAHAETARRIDFVVQAIEAAKMLDELEPR